MTVSLPNGQMGLDKVLSSQETARGGQSFRKRKVCVEDGQEEEKREEGGTGAIGGRDGRFIPIGGWSSIRRRGRHDVRAVMVTTKGSGGSLREDDQPGVSATLLLPSSHTPRRPLLPQSCLPIRPCETPTPLWPVSEQEESGGDQACSGLSSTRTPFRFAIHGLIAVGPSRPPVTGWKAARKWFLVRFHGNM